MPRRTKAVELLDFEISFYERLVKTYPDFVDVLVPLGEAYTRRGQHDKGLAVDLRLTQLREQDPIMWYNLACSYSLLNRVDDAIAALKQSIVLGYSDFEHMRNDPDLLNVRRSAAFRQLLDLLRRPVS